MARFSKLAHAWVVTADMGLGHQRAAYPLRSIAEGGIMTLGKQHNTSPGEHKQWERLRRSYEFLSRTKSWPIIGNTVFGILDRLQNIPPFYPIRDMSNPSFQVSWLKGLIEKGMCAGMLQEIKAHPPLPLVTTFYAPAIAADMAGLSRVYCVICDAEVNRAWVAENPRTSKIVYLVPCGRAVRRLNSYGIPNERIWLTGFPIPTEILGNHSLDVLRWDMGQRLHYLDPEHRFWPLHGRNVEHFLGPQNCRFAKKRVLTITFGVGGAGAQVDIAYQIAKSLRDQDHRWHGALQHPCRRSARGEHVPGIHPQGAGLSADRHHPRRIPGAVLRGVHPVHADHGYPLDQAQRAVLLLRPGDPRDHGAPHRVPGGV